MADKNERNPSQVPEEASEVDLENFVPKDEVEQLRRDWQSQKDREVARLTERARQEGEETGRQRLLEELNSNPEFEDLRDQLALQAKLAKADYYEQQERQRRELTQYRQQLTETFGIDGSALEGAATKNEMFQLALKARDERLLQEFKKSVGVEESPPEEEEGEGEEPPRVPIARGPAPDAAAMTAEEWENQLEEYRTAAKDMSKPKRERDRAKREWLKLQSRRPRASRRARV